ncbi:Ribosomal protein 63, mitochondrial [Holothuria leucospilota]|uniref:Ribosomal protein 63, mitochondrial n=1 Tax=Holothuria leucospilota TaxID=206669 RepID=A0A9Q1CDR7_HOLLE|nr:Ribosomal protein 63, mitochondrial [Holothuria leucospilota]
MFDFDLYDVRRELNPKSVDFPRTGNSVTGRTPSRIYRKHRRYRHITDCMVANLKKRLAIEEENARHLSRPYLTKEESHGHMLHLRHARKAAFFREKYFEKVKPNKTVEDHLSYLKVTKTW